MVVDSGLIIIDDYYAWDGCARAVHDYLSEIKSPSRLRQWNNGVAYLIKKS
jgi:O-methyltransferase